MVMDNFDLNLCHLEHQNLVLRYIYLILFRSFSPFHVQTTWIRGLFTIEERQPRLTTVKVKSVYMINGLETGQPRDPGFQTF